MKASEIKNLSAGELKDEADKCRRVLFDLRIQKSTQKLENVHQIRNTRRDLARVLTVLSQKRKTQAPEAR